MRKTIPALPEPIRNCFYAPWIKLQEKRDLQASSPDGLDEVYNLRVLAGRITRRLALKEPEEYNDSDLKLITALVRISVGIGALVRGNFSMHLKDGSLERELAEDVASLGEDWSQA